MDTKRELNPRRSFNGKFLLKSLDCCLDVSTARNRTSAVREKQSETNEATANTLNEGSPSKVGLPVWSLVPPGTVVDVAKETPAMSAATTEQDSEVLLSHSQPSLTCCLWLSMKISPGVRPLSLVWKIRYCGTMFFTNCLERKRNHYYKEKKIRPCAYINVKKMDLLIFFIHTTMSFKEK